MRRPPPPKKGKKYTNIYLINYAYITYLFISQQFYLKSVKRYN